MRKIERTTQFKKDFRRELKGRHRPSLATEFIDVIEALLRDQPLDIRHRDHALAGRWHDHRDCHIRPDLVLIYRKLDDDILQLVRLGSHSELAL